jgi:hypothetical protein
LFAQCTPVDRSAGVEGAAAAAAAAAIGSVTLAFINPSAAPVVVKGSSSSSGSVNVGSVSTIVLRGLQLLPRVEYILTSAANATLPRDVRMRARQMQLNGTVLGFGGASLCRIPCCCCRIARLLSYNTN